MKERPIIFSAPMVRAIIEGRKKMTRRVIRQFPATGYRWGGWIVEGARGDEGKATIVPEGNMPYMAQGQIKARCPYGQPSDRLWVRETWRYAGWTEDGYPFIEYAATPGRMHLRENIPDEWNDKISSVWADLSDPKNYNIDGSASDRCWRPSIFMPRWASRITLEIAAVRVERVQDISNDDSKSEGVDEWNGDEPCDYRGRFRELWDSINDKRGYGWGANPWVWVLEFKRIEP